MMQFHPFDTQRVFRSKSTLYLLVLSTIFKLCQSKKIVRSFSWILSSSYIGKSIAEKAVRAVLPLFAAGVHFGEVEKVAKNLKCFHEINSIVDESVEETNTDFERKMNMLRKYDLLKLCSIINNNQNTCKSNVHEKKPTIKFSPIKLSSLISPQRLEEISLYLQDLRKNAGNCNEMGDSIEISDNIFKNKLFLNDIENIESLCKAARQLGLSILIDAEESHRQPAVNALAREVSRRINTLGEVPVVYNTYQMYLKQGLRTLSEDLKIAEYSGYVFAGKIVRGAYRESESRRELLTGNPALHSNKPDTDRDYHQAIETVLRAIAQSPKGDEETGFSTQNLVVRSYNCSAAVVIATHNSESVCRAVQLMESLDLRPSHPGIHFAQIQGMGDHLTLALADSGYNAHKLLLFGDIANLTPWFVRRLQENQVTK